MPLIILKQLCMSMDKARTAGSHAENSVRYEGMPSVKKRIMERIKEMVNTMAVTAITDTSMSLPPLSRWYASRTNAGRAASST